MQPANDNQAFTRRGGVFLSRLHSVAVRDSRQPWETGAAFLYGLQPAGRVIRLGGANTRLTRQGSRRWSPSGIGPMPSRNLVSAGFLVPQP